MKKRLCLVVCVVAVAVLGARAADAATRTVCASGCTHTDLQAAIDAASFGDRILLRAGQTYTGHYVLRAKSGTGWIEIRSDAPDTELPAADERLVPSDRPGGTTPRSRLARIVGRGGAYLTVPLFKTDPGAHGYAIRFLELDGTAHLGSETLVQLGAGTTATPPYDITFDRVYVHGHATKGQKRGFSFNGRSLTLKNSYVSDIKSAAADSQAVAAWNGAGPFLIENNYLEATGENILFGGGDPAIANLVQSDITIRGNHIYKPLSWRNAILTAPASPRATSSGTGSLAAGTHYFRVVAVMATGPATAVSLPSTAVSATVGAGGAVTVSWSAVAGADKYRVYRGSSATSQSVYLESTSTSFSYKGASEKSGAPPSSGSKWIVKNSFELKNAARVTVTGNLIENSWQAGQAGYAIMLTPRNSGAAPWTRVQDVTFTNNIVRHVAGVVNISGYDDTNPTQRTERITFRNNLLYDVNHTTYGANARAFLVGNGAASLTFDRNTIIHTSSSVLYDYGAAMPGLVYTSNISQHHTYGIMGQGSSVGTPTLTTYFPGSSVRCNVLAGGSASKYPTPNSFPTVAQWTASFVNAAANDYTLIAGSPVALGGCSGVVPGADVAAVLDATSGAQSGQPGNSSEPPAANQPPVADAGGPYTTSVNTLVSVDGSGSSDPEGSVLHYRWHWGDEILVRAADLPASALRGSEWVRTDASDAAGGEMISNPDRRAAKRDTALASPSSYVEVTINAAAGVPYYLWMRLRSAGNAYANDSLYLQFDRAVDAAGAPLARIGTTNGLPMILEQGTGAGIAGWGWTDSGWNAVAPPIYFAQSGLQTIRVQAREDGVSWDQIVLSSAAHTTLPGATKNDNTFLDEDFGTSLGVSATHRYARTGVYPVVLVVTDTAGAAGSAAATVTVR